MTEIRIVIEGEDAIAATNTLLEIQGISGYAEVTEAPERETLLGTVVAIVTIVGVTVEIVEQFRKWYEGCKKEKVVIIGPNGQRVSLTGNTIDDETIMKIVKILDDSRQ
jgi:predicted ester cyclase